MFEQLLEVARAGDLKPELALRILEDSRSPENALKLFAVASKLRDEHIGRELWWTAAIEGIMPCRLDPPCSYCTYSNHEIIDTESLLSALKALEKMGFRHLHLSGGTKLDGYDREILAMVEAMRAVSDVDIEVNLGPSITRETVRKLKHLGVCSVTSSLETLNEELFRAAKPGDSLEKRKELLEMCEAEGMPTRSMMLVGLGESDADRIRQLFYLRRFKGFQTLRFSRFFPFPSTSFRNLPRCSPWELARTVAVARLIMPDVQLGLAAGNTHDDIPLWFLAGGGNQLLGAAAVRKKVVEQPATRVTHVIDGIAVVDRGEIQERYIREMGLTITTKTPGHAKR
jgi:biotin synthase